MALFEEKKNLHEIIDPESVSVLVRFTEFSARILQFFFFRFFFFHIFFFFFKSWRKNTMLSNRVTYTYESEYVLKRTERKR